MKKKSFLLQCLLISLIMFFAFTNVYAIPVPQGEQIFSYTARTSPYKTVKLAEAIPIGVGSVAKGGALLSPQIRIGSFSERVDIYFAVSALDIHPEVLFMWPDGSFNPLSAGIVPTWENTLGDIQYTMGNIPTTDLPDGIYTFYFGVVPADAVTLDNSYIWETKFTICPEATFELTYGGKDDDYGKSVQQTSDCGYIITGYTHENDDDYLIKTDSHGNILWKETYSGEDSAISNSVQQTFDGGYIIAGNIVSSGGYAADIYLLKTDSDGDVLWTQTYGEEARGEGSNSVQQTSDGGYIILGNTDIYDADDSDIYLIKTDSEGNVLWTETYGGESADVGNLVQQTSDGGYIITGYTSSEGAGWNDVYLIKTDLYGNILWTETYGGTNDDRGYSVQQISDGGYIIAGTTRTEAGGFDVYLIKTDSDGDALWIETYGGQDDDIGLSVQQTSDGGYIIAGTTSFMGPPGDVYLIKTDSDGDALWIETYGGTSRDEGYSVQQTSDGGYIIAGSMTNTENGYDYDIYLIKTDSKGEIN